MFAVEVPPAQAFGNARKAGRPRAQVFSGSRGTAVNVANDAAGRWLEEVLAGRCGADEFARHVTSLARRHRLDLTAWACRAIAECFEREARVDRALQFYAKAAGAAPEDPDTLNSYGAALGRARRYRKSVRVLRQARSIHPRDAMILTNLGLSLSEIDKSEEALDAVEGALAVAPTYARAWAARACVQRRLGSLDEALGDAIRARDLEPKWAWTWGLVAGLLFELKRWDEALVALDGADALDPPTPHALLLRAASSLAVGRLGATADALRALDADPGTPALRAQRSDAQALESEIRGRLEAETRLTPLIDSVKIYVPPEVDLTDWDQLSAYLLSDES